MVRMETTPCQMASGPGGTVKTLNLLILTLHKHNEVKTRFPVPVFYQFILGGFKLA